MHVMMYIIFLSKWQFSACHGRYLKNIMMKVLELMMVYILIYHCVVKLVHIWMIQLLIEVHF